MVTIEQIDEFRKRTNSSYGDAKYFLEKNQGDLLEAIIDFERTRAGKSHGFQQKKNKDDFSKVFAEILQKGFDYRIFVEDKNSTLFSFPVIFLILLIPVWIIILLFFIFLYILGYRFSIRNVKNRNIDVNSFFQNINNKMKESGMNKAKPQNSSPQQGDGEQTPNSPDIVASDMTPPAKTEDATGKKGDNEEGYKEYTIE